MVYCGGDAAYRGVFRPCRFGEPLLYGSMSRPERRRGQSLKDLLYTYTAPQPPFVYSTILVNVGTTKNTGIEVSLDGDILTKTAVKWTSGINYSYGKTKLMKYRLS